MKTMKFLSLAALALTFAACSSDDDALTAQQPAEQPGEVTITATIDINDGAKTRALTTDGSKVTSTWTVGEKIAVLFEYNSAQTVREAEVKTLSGTTANVEFTIPADLTGSQTATLVYPATAVNAAKTGADVATALATQDGSIDNCPEVRTGSGTLDASAKTLTVGSALTAQTAIFKFTIQDLSAAAKEAADFTVSDASGNVITTVTPGSATGTLYVALPTLAAATYWFNATIDSKPYIAKATPTADLSASYYTQTVPMATIGDVILSDGKFAARSSTGTNVAMIAYLGSETDHATYKHGLALALTDEASTMNWTTATGASGAAAHTPAAPTTTSSWMLPSKDQWYNMIDACKNVLGTQNNYQDLRDGFSGISGASNLQSDLYSGFYWSSTEYDSGIAWGYGFGYGDWIYDYKSSDYIRVRACLAF